MKIHPRERLVTQASLDVRTAFLEASSKYDLTDGERLRVACEVFSDTVGHTAKYMIRQERHPEDSDKPGGLE